MRLAPLNLTPTLTEESTFQEKSLTTDKKHVEIELILWRQLDRFQVAKFLNQRKWRNFLSALILFQKKWLNTRKENHFS